MNHLAKDGEAFTFATVDTTLDDSIAGIGGTVGFEERELKWEMMEDKIRMLMGGAAAVEILYGEK